MPSKNTTTVVLNDEARKIKDSLGPVFGLKAIHSAGYIWFNQLSADQQREIVGATKLKKTLTPIVLAIIEQNSKTPGIPEAVRAIKNQLVHNEILGGEDKEMMDELFTALKHQAKLDRKKRRTGT